MRYVRVIFEDGNTLETNINGTNESIRKYYIGESFNFGDREEHPADKMVKAINVVFLDQPLEPDMDCRAKFAMDCEVTIYESTDEEAEPLVKLFKKGDEIEFFIVDHPEKFNGDRSVEDKNLINIQFPNGSIATCVSIDWLTEVEEV